MGHMAMWTAAFNHSTISTHTPLLSQTPSTCNHLQHQQQQQQQQPEFLHPVGYIQESECSVEQLEYSNDSQLSALLRGIFERSWWIWIVDVG